MEGKKLYRSKSNQWVSGVLAGLAKYLGVDPIVTRVIGGIIIVGTGGVGILVYILMMIVIPIDPSEKNLPGRKTSKVVWIVFFFVAAILFFLVRAILKG